MDRRIRAILAINNIDDLSTVEIIDYSDGKLEIVKDGEVRYLSLNGEITIDEVEEQLEEIRESEEIKEKEPISEIIEDADDEEFFEDDEKVEDVEFDIDLDDDFDFEDEVKDIEVPSQEEKLEKVIEAEKKNPVKATVTKMEIKEEKKEKPKKKPRTKKKREDSGDDYINLL